VFLFLILIFHSSSLFCKNSTLIFLLSHFSFVVEFKGDVPVHNVDPQQSPAANLFMPNQDSVVIVSSAANFSHPQYDESATSSMFLLVVAFLNIVPFHKPFCMI
jgi:hypothetical protein